MSELAKVIQGDCRGVMQQMDADSIDTIITDPPYGLSFMGKEWDHGVPGEPFWREALRVAKPGAMLLAFGGTRTYHRMTVAIEDAGWEIRDCMMWLYGSGFPKSHDISKGIDKSGGVSASFSAFRDDVLNTMSENGIARRELQDALGNYMVSHYLTAGSQPAIPNYRDYKIIRDTVGLGDRWDGLFAAAAEREVVGKSKHKPGIANGTCGHHTVGGTIAQHVDITAPATDAAKLWDGYGTALKPAWEPIIVAMKPLDGTFANNALTHGVAGLNIDGARIGTESTKRTNGKTAIWADGEMNNEEGGSESGRWPANVILDEQAGAMLDEQSGDAGGGFATRGASSNIYGGGEGFTKATGETIGFGDTGGASRFFYCAKASRSERGEFNTHPTVKPLDLMAYLCKLTATPTGGVILDPFCGSGSTLVAAAKLGRPSIGIDLDPHHCEIARRRIAHATGPLFAGESHD